jgi:hypothetical protein
MRRKERSSVPPPKATNGRAQLLQRAQQYVAQASAASEGNRNNAAFSLAGNVAALVCEEGDRLGASEIVDVLRPWNLRNDPPLDDTELQRCVANALTNGKPRTAKPAKSSDRKKKCGGKDVARDMIANYELVEVEDENGKIKKTPMPLPMSTIIDAIIRRIFNWPRRVDRMLFVDDEHHGLDYFDRRTTAGLFGWLRRNVHVDWRTGSDYVAQAELFAEFERTAQRYDAIELLPHEPPINGIYYRCDAPKTGNGSHLRTLLDRFRPETTIDRYLIQSAFMTAFWGGPPGCRPIFVVTSDDGRGVGKSQIPQLVGHLCNGMIDASPTDDIEDIKTRMLTPTARTKRVALLDNVKSLRFSWGELEALVTNPIISGRQLYVGEGQRPNLLTWFIR